MTTNAALLRNKGTEILLAVVEPVAKIKERIDIVDGEVKVTPETQVEWAVKEKKDGSPHTIQEWIRFTNASLAEIQDHYGSMEAYQAQFDARPNDVVAKSLTVMLGGSINDPAALGRMHARILPEEFSAYQVAIMAMLAVANGVDPTYAAEMIEEGRLAAKDQVAEANKAMAEAVEEMRAERESAEESTTSKPSSGSGSESDDPTPSSGS